METLQTQPGTAEKHPVTHITHEEVPGVVSNGVGRVEATLREAMTEEPPVAALPIITEQNAIDGR